MSKKDFLDFSESTKHLNFGIIPFTKVCSLTFTQVFGEIHFREIHSGEGKTLNIKPVESPRERPRKKTSMNGSRGTNLRITFQTPKSLVKIHKLSANKKRDQTYEKIFTFT